MSYHRFLFAWTFHSAGAIRALLRSIFRVESEGLSREVLSRSDEAWHMRLYGGNERGGKRIGLRRVSMTVDRDC